MDLSPLAAARTVVDITVESPPDPAARTSQRLDQVLASERQREEQAALEAPQVGRVGEIALGHTLKRSVMTALRPWELVLHPLTGGRYRYEGEGFVAIIRHDGSVEMRDHSEVHLTVVPIKESSNGPAKPGIGLRLPNPIEWLAKQTTQDDPYRAERLRFLEETKELRELLFERARRRELARADQQLARELQRIWSKQGSAFVAEQQQQTFRLWDECADDEVGSLRREQIVAYVRERCPRESPCAFDATALARLNGQRRSRMVFAPYEPEGQLVLDVQRDAGVALPSR